MTSDKIIFYDEEFIANFKKLGEVLETGDRPAIHRFLIDHFGYIFRTCQYYWFDGAQGKAKELTDADEEIKNELIRPLSHRQYRLVENSFSPWKHEEDLVISSIWDFLHDNGRIYEKKVMSTSEVAGCSIILENVYSCLSRKR